MGYRTLNSYLFEINEYKDWKEMFIQLDNDWTLPKEEQPDYMLPKEFNSLDEMIEKYLSYGEDEYRINLIMEAIQNGHGSFSSDFQWEYREQDGTYFISIAFLT